MEIKEVDINLLKPAEYNPRFLSDDEARHLDESLEEFGMVEPIVVNSDPDRLNIIIGGHQRYFRCKVKGYKTLPVVYVNIPDIEKEKRLNLRLNKNVGHFDLFKLSKFEKSVLSEVGWDSQELDKIFREVTIEEKPEVVFTEELTEAHNYVVLYFDNEVDWLQLQSLFPLPTVKALDSREGYEKKGVGRVIRGVDFIKKITGV